MAALKRRFGDLKYGPTPRRPPRMARADCVLQPVPVFVRLRRDHELHGALRRRERRHAQEHLPDRTCDCHPVHEADRRAPGRSLRLQARLRAMPGADLPWPGTPRRGRHARLADCIGGRLRPGLRHRLSGLCRLRDAGRRCRSARRRVRRDPGRVRHRHRHGIDVDGLSHPALRLCVRLQRRRRAIGACAAVFPGRRSVGATEAAYGGDGENGEDSPRRNGAKRGETQRRNSCHGGRK